MNEHHEPLLTDPRSYESESGDVLPLDNMIDPVTERPDSLEYRIVQVSAEETKRINFEDTVQKYLANQALAEQVFVEPPASSKVEEKRVSSERLTPAAALIMLHEGNGFYPHEHVEKNSLLAIAGRSTEYEHPVLAYLNQIKVHQRNNEVKDPIEALRSKLKSFGDYAKQADVEKKFGFIFKNAQTERGYDDDRLVSDSLSVNDFRGDILTRRTLTTLARIHETELFIEDKAPNPLGARSGVDSLKDHERDNRIMELLGDMKFSELMSLNARMMLEEGRRFEYWHTQVGEIVRHKAIHEEASQLLARLDELHPPQSGVGSLNS